MSELNGHFLTPEAMLCVADEMQAMMPREAMAYFREMFGDDERAVRLLGQVLKENPNISIGAGYGRSKQG